MADRIEHVAHLPVAAFRDHDLDDRFRTTLAFHGLAEGDAGFKRLLAVQHDTFAQTLELVIIRDAEHTHVVRALELMARMRHHLGEVAVVGEQQQTFRVVVESADRIEISLHTELGQQIDDRLAVLWIRARGDHARRLVEQVVLLGVGKLQPPAVDLDVVALGIGFRAELRHDLAIDLNTALRNQFIRKTA